jgi:hypothetical protein
MRDSILITLLRSHTALTAREIATRLEGDVSDIGKACSVMLGKGLLCIGEGRPFGTSIIPTWELTSAGEYEAREAQAARRNAAVMGTEKPQGVE